MTEASCLTRCNTSRSVIDSHHGDGPNSHGAVPSHTLSNIPDHSFERMTLGVWHPQPQEHASTTRKSAFRKGDIHEKEGARI